MNIQRHKGLSRQTRTTIRRRPLIVLAYNSRASQISWCDYLHALSDPSSDAYVTNQTGFAFCLLRHSELREHIPTGLFITSFLLITQGTLPFLNHTWSKKYPLNAVPPWEVFCMGHGWWSRVTPVCRRVLWRREESDVLDSFRSRKGAYWATHLTCMIMTISPKEFVICWNDSNFSYASLGRVTIDGIQYSGKFIFDLPSKSNYTTSYASARVTLTARRPFVFSTLELTGNEVFSVTRGKANISNSFQTMTLTWITLRLPTWETYRSIFSRCRWPTWVTWKVVLNTRNLVKSTNVPKRQSATVLSEFPFFLSSPQLIFEGWEMRSSAPLPRCSTMRLSVG